MRVVLVARRQALANAVLHMCLPAFIRRICQVCGGGKAVPRERLLTARSLNQLVGTQQKRLRDREAERLRSPEVDDQAEFRRLLDR